MPFCQIYSLRFFRERILFKMLERAFFYYESNLKLPTGVKKNAHMERMEKIVQKLATVKTTQIVIT